MAPPASLFLKTLFGDKPAGAYILLWQLAGRRSTWFTDIDAAARHAASIASNDTYVGVALSPADLGPGKRCEAAQTLGITALWADIDIADPAHKKGNLPPDMVAAVALVDELGLKPSILIHSGHGLQVWWLLREPWIFEDDADRERAAALAKAWTDTIRSHAQDHGWTVDATGDLARVMRVPGTKNRKGVEPVDVRLLQIHPDVAYNPDDFEELLRAPLDVHALNGRTDDSNDLASDIKLDPDASPPFDKFEIFLFNIPKAKSSWERRRRDLADTSPSGYDMSLATLAVGAGWPDQDVVDLLISARRKHGDDLKLRLDYYRGVLRKAREWHGRQVAEEEGFTTLIADSEALRRAQIDGDEAEAARLRQSSLENVVKATSIPISRIVRYKADPPIYRLYTEDGQDIKASTDALIDFRKFRIVAASLAYIILDKKLAKQWDPVAQAIMRAAENAGIGDEATEQGRIRSWLGEYLLERPPQPDFEAALVSGTPFVRNGVVHIIQLDFSKWARITFGVSESPQMYGAAFRAIGCDYHAMPVTVAGRATTRGVWKLPNEFIVFAERIKSPPSGPLPSEDSAWREVAKGEAVVPGHEVRVDARNGKSYVRLDQ